MEVFVDTSAFYALTDRSDDCHERALAYFSEACFKEQFFTSEYVVVETWGLLNNRLGKKAADRFWDWALSGVITLLGVSIEDLIEARKISRRYADQSYSLVDCVSFRLMARYDIPTAFAFDRHFRSVRVGGKAFRTVP